MSINDVKIKIITDKSQKAIIYEIAIPWKYVIPFKPFIHNKWGINLIYIDRDGNQRTILQLYPDKNYDTESTDKRQGAIFDFINHTPSEHEFQSTLNASHFYDDKQRVLTYAVNSPTENSGWTLSYFLTSASGTISRKKEITVKKGMNLYTSDIESGDNSTDSYILSVAILDDKNSLKYTQDWSYFLINREEFNNTVSKIDKIKEGEQYSKDLVFKESLPTLEIRLEWIKKFKDEAPPFADTAFLREWYEEMETLLKNVDEGKPALFPPGTIGRLAHRSNIDDTLQPYSVVIRPDYDPKESYPLFVTLHGSGVDERNMIMGMARVHYMRAPKRKWANFIILAPKARGLSDWYLENSGKEVIECIEHIKKLYNIDEKNIILDGFSMGGYGAWRLSAIHPEVFKAVIIRSGAIRPPAVNGENILTLLYKKLDTEYFIVHGAKDNAVSVGNARKAVEKLKELGIKHRYLELKNAAHGNYEKWDEIFDWLKKIMKVR
jgi:predicted esterase